MKRKSGRQLIQQGRATLLKHKQTLITAFLLATLLLLLFGIFSQLPAPEPITSQRDITAINYNTFLAQVRADNVLVVSLQDQEIVGTLARPLSGGKVTPTSRTNMTQQQAETARDVWNYTPAAIFPTRGLQQRRLFFNQHNGSLPACLKVATRRSFPCSSASTL
jgi:hypothetical protein